TEGVSNGLLRKTMDTVFRDTLPLLTDYLPDEIRRKYKFPTLQTALKHLHAPEDMGKTRAALRRLAFDDIFLFALGMAFSKKKAVLASAPRIAVPVEDTKRFLSLLPYQGPGAQTRACGEILADMEKGVAMNRILVGDVGCGKTVCAAFAAFAALVAGHQAAIMAPTEILARQHYEELSDLFGRLGYRVALLLGATSQKEKKNIYSRLSSTGEERIDLVIGTHALLSDKTVFSDLALAVTDEQHRFGVHQRAVLREKCPSVHLLVMSATPIPRTLALVLYGDLDLSRIDEMPKGRRKVATYVVGESYRTRLYAFIRKQVAEGGQVYVVCPAIEEKAEDEEDVSFDLLGRPSAPPLKTAKEVSETMRQALPELSVDFLHGRMRSADKEAVMRRFASGETHVLVSTTVIEVGVNVPRASLMIVENAERFGLSQLHQLRGRVGRGTKESYCVLLSDSESAEAKARLETMRTTYDGYLVAEQDLKQRGPGDFLVSSGAESVRQSGGLSFRFASLCEDTSLLSAAAEEAKAILTLSEKDATAFWEENKLLFEETRRAFDVNAPLLS
ncbi:MAG: ATP-dependent DNA helicase RecG, partial [Clostridia bacterium]|nr:ATP-dependent DNA helicase RecG [Clostridia bacterium]